MPGIPRLGRSRPDTRSGLLVLTGLAGYVGLVYVTVVLGGGVLIGSTDSPNLALSVLATVIVALGFEPVQRRLERFANQVVRGGHASPYDVLSRFTETVTATQSSEQTTGRMCRLLAEGTGASWAQVWLVVGDRLTLAANWPPDGPVDVAPPVLAPDAVDDTGPGRRALPVRHGGELLGVLRLQERDRAPLSPVEERLFAGLAAQAGLVLRLSGLRTSLSQRLDELSARAAELQASRERLIETQDEERRKLERDIHDGAQQHLVALAVNLRLAQTLATTSPDRAAQVVSEQGEAAQAAIATLTQLSKGIYPHLLAEGGLVPALQAAVATSPVPVQITAEPGPRPPANVEAALYFCALEALQNAAKHSGARHARVDLSAADGTLRMTVDDDGTGFDPDSTETGAGLANMRDRIDAAGGRLQLDSTPGVGTHLEVQVPVSPVPSQRAG